MSAKRLAVIGDPIRHSLSPRIQNAAIAAAGLDAAYESVHVRPEALPSFMEAARSGAFVGFNVTIPHKQRVASMLDALRGGAAEIGAANTVVREEARLIGYNTDVPGFLAALRSSRPGASTRALVLGAGGSARAVAFGLRSEGVSVSVSSRRDTAAADLARQFEGVRVVPWGDREAEIAECDLVVNATPLGMAHLAGSTPVTRWPDASVPKVAFDLVYGLDTPFLHEAASAGWQTIGGVEMLIQQAAESFRLWFGREPHLEAMRQACRLEESACSAS